MRSGQNVRLGIQSLADDQVPRTEPKQTQPRGKMEGVQVVEVQGAAGFNLSSFILKIYRSSGWLHGFGRQECNFLPLERASKLSSYV